MDAFDSSITQRVSVRECFVELGNFFCRDIALPVNLYGSRKLRFVEIRQEVFDRLRVNLTI